MTTMTEPLGADTADERPALPAQTGPDREPAPVGGAEDASAVAGDSAQGAPPIGRRRRSWRTTSGVRAYTEAAPQPGPRPQLVPVQALGRMRRRSRGRRARCGRQGACAAIAGRETAYGDADDDVRHPAGSFLRWGLRRGPRMSDSATTARSHVAIYAADHYEHTGTRRQLTPLTSRFATDTHQGAPHGEIQCQRRGPWGDRANHAPFAYCSFLLTGEARCCTSWLP